MRLIVLLVCLLLATSALAVPVDPNAADGVAAVWHSDSLNHVFILTTSGECWELTGITPDEWTHRAYMDVPVPVPTDVQQIVEAIAQGLLLSQHPGTAGEQLLMFEETLQPKREELHRTWDLAAEKEKRSRTMFAQQTIKDR